jgi:hypothetical protein
MSAASAAATDCRHAIFMSIAAALVVASVSLIELHLVVFHSVDGHEVAINPAQVTTMYAAKDDQENKLFVDSVRCVIGLTDGKFVTVAENCNVVKRLLEETAK